MEKCPLYLSGKGNIKISNPTLVEGYRWWRTTGKISTQHSTCISVATVQTRNYTELNVNISQQCLFCSMPHLIWKKCIGLRKFGENRKQPKERSETKSQGKILKHLWRVKIYPENMWPRCRQGATSLIRDEICWDAYSSTTFRSVYLDSCHKS